MNSKNYNLQSQINLSRGRGTPKLLIRRLSGDNKAREIIHVEENQSLDVVKQFAESISANFTVLIESMTNGFQKLGENLNVMNDDIISLVHWPRGELCEDVSEQVDVNEVSEGFEKHPNDGENADESATGHAGPFHLISTPPLWMRCFSSTLQKVFFTHYHLEMRDISL